MFIVCGNSPVIVSSMSVLMIVYDDKVLEMFASRNKSIFESKKMYMRVCV